MHVEQSAIYPLFQLSPKMNHFCLASEAVMPLDFLARTEGGARPEVELMMLKEGRL